MSDYISRQDAVCAIEEYEDRLQMVNWEENPNVPYKVHALNWAVNTIREMPSVEPERKKGKWIMNDNSTYSCSVCHSWIPEEQHYYARYCLYFGGGIGRRR